MDIDLNALEPRHAHDLLTSCLIPRPIAWVATVDGAGRHNLAPFSFFTGVQWHPPVLAVSVVNRADGTRKDTVVNIEQTGEFVVNLVSTELLHAMERTAAALPAGEDEALLPDIRLAPSRMVRPCRVAEARVAFECALERIVRVDEGPNAGNLILGRVLSLHVRDDLLIDGREVDWRGLDPLGRLSGDRYCAVESVLVSEKH